MVGHTVTLIHMFARAAHWQYTQRQNCRRQAQPTPLLPGGMEFIPVSGLPVSLIFRGADGLLLCMMSHNTPPERPPAVPVPCPPSTLPRSPFRHSAILSASHDEVSLCPGIFGAVVSDKCVRPPEPCTPPPAHRSKGGMLHVLQKPAWSEVECLRSQPPTFRG